MSEITGSYARQPLESLANAAETDHAVTELGGATLMEGADGAHAGADAAAGQRDGVDVHSMADTLPDEGQWRERAQAPQLPVRGSPLGPSPLTEPDPTSDSPPPYSTSQKVNNHR